MRSKKKISYLLLILFFACIGAALLGKVLFLSDTTATQEIIPITEPKPVTTENTAPQTANKNLIELIKAYGDIPLIDAHNHDASDYKYIRMKNMWETTAVDRIVLFGDVSEPSAVKTDEIAWEAYRDRPEVIIPFFSGINLLESSGVDAARTMLEKGYFGIGEIAAASTNSPVLSRVAWKTKDSMDGFLPQIYELCAQYKAPVLLHIDPPNGFVIEKFKDALASYPNTTFIFAHANAFNSPGNIRELLKTYPNVYADFFAGFTAFNPESSNKLKDFIPIMKEFPDRFVLSTDSGFGLKSEEQAIEGMYRLIDELGDKKIATMIAYDNLYALIRDQPATTTQIEAIRKLDNGKFQTLNLERLTKLEAGEILVGKK
ncbi:amidohydrolase family protein [Paenibacillus sp. FSL H7-0331]|uniref:amidohydrolase family protein n=1 Tax=Paenibacillus sp. FSL H7-0331 TaxID=1920421 RepID=UPI00096BFF29|nr:amidohydrolase family protein [Paenibacillus sp. FSL H7-0331]OMF11246.1 amidohydrolase [Paenibacillus sp. FSL H7-0331]